VTKIALVALVAIGLLSTAVRGITKADKYLQASADITMAPNRYNRAVRIFSNAHTQNEYIKSRKLYELAVYKVPAEYRSDVALYNLALMNYNAQGGPKNLKEARRLFEEAAEIGLANSQYMLGFMRYHGEGGPKDLIGARRSFESAAIQRHAEAEHALNMMIAKREGLPKD